MVMLQQFTIASVVIVCTFVAFYIARVNRGYEKRDAQRRSIDGDSSAGTPTDSSRTPSA